MRRTNKKTTQLVRIGNARCLRIPKDWMEQLQVGDKVDIVPYADHLVIRKAGTHPRQGWTKALRAAAERCDDVLLEEWPPTQWDLTEWEW